MVILARGMRPPDFGRQVVPDLDVESVARAVLAGEATAEPVDRDGHPSLQSGQQKPPPPRATTDAPPPAPVPTPISVPSTSQRRWTKDTRPRRSNDRRA